MSRSVYEDFLEDELDDDPLLINYELQNKLKDDDKYISEEEPLSIIKEEESGSVSESQVQQQDHPKQQQPKVQYFNANVMLVDEDTALEKLTQEEMKLNLKTFREQMLEKEQEKKKIDSLFKKRLREQTIYLLTMDKKVQLEKKLNLKSPFDREEQLQKELEVEQQERELAKNIKKARKAQEKEESIKELQKQSKQIEALKLQLEQQIQENISLKQQHNEDQETIKFLKLSKPNLTQSNTSNISKSSNKTNIDAFQSELERIRNENVQLKKTLQEERQSFKIKMSRTHQVHKGLNDLQNNSQASTEQSMTDSVDPFKLSQAYSKSQAEMNQQMSILRNKARSLQEKIEDLNDQLQKKEKYIKELNEKLNMSSSYLIQMQKLESQIAERDNQLATIQERMMIDKQLELLFPNHCSLVVLMMNFAHMMEHHKLARFTMFRIANYVSNGIKSLKLWFRDLSERISFKINKSYIKHPSNQELVRIAIQKIRSCPTTYEKVIRAHERQLQKQQKEIESLNQEIEQMKQFEKERTERYAHIEELLHIDKINLATEVMMRLLKLKAENGMTVEDFPQIGIMERYVQLIFKSTRDDHINHKQNAKSPQKRLQSPRGNKQSPRGNKSPRGKAPIVGQSKPKNQEQKIEQKSDPKAVKVEVKNVRPSSSKRVIKK